MNRREFLWSSGGGLGGIALASLLAGEAKADGLHHPPKARRVVQLFMAGGASHIDLFEVVSQSQANPAGRRALQANLDRIRDSIPASQRGTFSLVE